MVKLVRNLPLEFPRELVYGEIPCLQYSAARPPKRYHEKPLLGRCQMLMVLGAGDHFGSPRTRVYCNQQEKLFSAPVFFQAPLLTKEEVQLPYHRGAYDSPLQHPCLYKSQEQRSLVGCSPWGYQESDRTDHKQWSVNLELRGRESVTGTKCLWHFLKYPFLKKYSPSALFCSSPVHLSQRRRRADNVSRKFYQVSRWKETTLKCKRKGWKSCHEKSCFDLEQMTDDKNLVASCFDLGNRMEIYY